MVTLSTGSFSSCSSSPPGSGPTLAEVLECRSMPVIGLQSRTPPPSHHTAHCTLLTSHTAHFTLHTAHHTLHTSQTKLNTSHYTLHRPHKLTVHSTLCNIYPSTLPTTTLTKSHSAQCTHFLLPLSQLAKNLRIHKVYCHWSKQSVTTVNLLNKMQKMRCSQYPDKCTIPKNHRM